MQRIKDHKTPYLIDPFHHLGPKRKRLLDPSWAGVFRKYVRPILPVHLLARHFSPDSGRPTKELVAMMGAMILQQMHDIRAHPEGSGPRPLHPGGRVQGSP